ncbi:hypothetical protein KP509_33G063800 [Ceratopteris richardii]|uniref:Uncharacterized protein n=1 Tax=Ceratopteris richardii TaxID=49495 RepID=A0A8T2QSC4_CERRI|nr:hypothetical protein KP509_33G063800 [Ceratopteris richardii]
MFKFLWNFMVRMRIMIGMCLCGNGFELLQDLCWCWPWLGLMLIGIRPFRKVSCLLERSIYLIGYEKQSLLVQMMYKIIRLLILCEVL